MSVDMSMENHMQCQTMIQLECSAITARKILSIGVQHNVMDAKDLVNFYSGARRTT